MEDEKALKVYLKQQLHFLVLQELNDNPDYDWNGIRLENLQAQLAENRNLWLRGKYARWYEKRLNFVLSDLNKENVLRKPEGTRNFYKGENFAIRLGELTKEIYDRLDVMIYFDTEEELSGRESVINVLKQGTIRYDFKERPVKENLILTDTNINGLVTLYVELGLLDFELKMRGILD